MKRIIFELFAAAACLVLPASLAAAADDFDPLPTVKGDGPSPLLIRIVKYEGSTNGSITVDVMNPTREAREFSAKGVYFVPKGSANEAPQRLGAVGPFKVLGAGGGQQREQITIGPGDVERLALDVYCIDSHRASPGPATSFRVAKDRVPPVLMHAIDGDAAQAASALGGVSAQRAKAAVQSEVWKNRDKKWIELDGEGRQEAGKQR